MKKSTTIQLLLMLILIAGVFGSSGCSDNSCEPGYKPQLPAKWAGGKFPLVEGAKSICTNENETGTLISYDGMPFPELLDKYEQKFKSAGWQFEPGQKLDMLATAEASKDGKTLRLQFSGCSPSSPRCAKISVNGL